MFQQCCAYTQYRNTAAQATATTFNIVFQTVFQLCAWHSSSLSYTVCHTYSTYTLARARPTFLKTPAMLMNAMMNKTLSVINKVEVYSTVSQACGHNYINSLYLWIAFTDESLCNT